MWPDIKPANLQKRDLYGESRNIFALQIPWCIANPCVRVIDGSPGHWGQRLLTGLVRGQCPFELKRQTRQNKHFSPPLKKKQRKKKRKIKRHLQDITNQSFSSKQEIMIDYLDAHKPLCFSKSEMEG